MAVQRKRGGSVVSRSGGGPVVSGSRRVGGRVIGEVLSGGRNISGVSAKRRQIPRPTRGSARHTLRPAPKAAAPKHDDYSDFGLPDNRHDDRNNGWNTEGFARPAAPSYNAGRGGHSAGLPRQRQDHARMDNRAHKATAALAQSLGLFFFFVVAYIILNKILQDQGLQFLRAGVIPLALTVWLGAKTGSAIKREARRGLNPGAALIFSAFGALFMGAGLYAAAQAVGLYPLFMVTGDLDLPYTLHQYINIIDLGVSRLFATFRLATYAVAPLSGILLGWIFGRR